MHRRMDNKTWITFHRKRNVKAFIKIYVILSHIEILFYTYQIDKN